MRMLNPLLGAAALACALVVPAAHAGEVDPKAAEAFTTMCDKDKDGMVSKAEMMKMMEQMFDKHDKKKMGKLDKKQVEDLLREITRSS